MQTDTLQTLNENQREAAAILDSHVRIIAGAGSGKTRTLITRIAYLIHEAGIQPWRILAITFTNKAAREMKERLDAMLGPDASHVVVSTIHSFCVRLLRQEAGKLGYPSRFVILDTEDAKAILRPIYKQMEVDRNEFPPARTLAYISNCKSAGQSPQKAAQTAYTVDHRILSSIYKEYEKVRLDMKAMDFDDLLLETRKLLKTHPDVKEKWSQKFDYIHVDEFQDVDEVQYEIVRMLTGEDTKLCVVGDPDQTIYTWRGAQVDIILNFEKDFPNARTVILNENYRSNPAILHAANALISNNKDRIEKDLFTRNTQSVAIETHETPDSQQEPFQAVRFIRKAKEKGIPYKDMAILYRSNYLSRSFERILAKLNIPHRIYGGVRFYERQEIKDILCYLRLIAKPDPDDPEQKSLNLAAARVLNVPKRGIGAKSLENLNQEAAQSDKNLMEVLRQPTSVSAAVAKKLQPFVQLIDELKMLDLPLDQLAQEVINRTGYAAMLAENKEEERKENLSELVQDIRESMKDNPELTLEEYLQDVTLFTDREEEAENAVSLMTVHASKGLEFPAVMIVGLNEGVFPNNRAVEENGRQGLEEERRLLYVAMTRAKQYLYLSWNLGYSAMQQAYARPSRFLMEIPEEDIEHSKDGNNVKAVNPTTHKVHTVTRVQRLRPGDHVEHTLFGEGVVIKVEGGIASIAFAHKFGLKQLKADHPAIHKL